MQRPRAVPNYFGRIIFSLMLATKLRGASLCDSSINLF